MRIDKIDHDAEREKGRRQAEADIASGSWKIHQSHDNDDASVFAAEIVRRMCGLDFDLRLSFHDVIVGGTLLRHARACGYNDRVREELVSRFGRDVREEAMAEAEEQERRRAYEPRLGGPVIAPEIDVPTFMRRRRSGRPEKGLQRRRI